MPKLLLFLLFSFTLSSCNTFKGQNYTSKNSLWAESYYFRGYKLNSGYRLTEDDIKNYVKLLKDNGIGYIYVFSGPFGSDGHLPAYPFSKVAQQSVSLFKKYYPELMVLPWIGGIQGKTVFLNDSTWVYNALSDAKKLISFLKVKGVHVDFEHIVPEYGYIDTGIIHFDTTAYSHYTRNVNKFHNRLRAMSPHAFISSVVVPDCRDSKPWKLKTTSKDLKELLISIDQLSLLYYDTGISDSLIFDKNCNELLRNMADLKLHHKKVNFQIGLGTFQNPNSLLQKFRHLDIENLKNSIRAINAAEKNLKPLTNPISGIALFCDWQTSDDEWEDFKQYWLMKN
ncbi:glycoside hydrolase family 18 protein [Mucilaginibacter phyllosphaerae]